MAAPHARVATAALAAGLTLGVLLVMPTAVVRPAGPAAPLMTSSAALPLPASVPTATRPTTTVPEPPVAAAGEPTPAAPAPTSHDALALQPAYPVSALTASGIPESALEAYRRAAAGAPCSVDWTLLAAIGRVESNHGRFGGASLHSDGLSEPPILGPILDGAGFALIPDTDSGAVDGDAVHDRAVGPMQFIPSTWALFGRDGNGDGRADPFNIYDSTAAAAAYLCKAGGDLSTVAGQARAVFAYNHSDSYVATVLNLAAAYAGTPPPVIPPTVAESAPVPPANPGPPPAVDQVTVAAASPAVTTAAPPANSPATASVTTSPSVPSAAAATTTPSAAAATTTPATTTPAPPSTTPPSTTPTTTPPSTTPTTTPPSTTPTTTPPVTTPPVTTPPVTTPAPTPAPTPATSPCPTPAPVTIDVRNTTGDPAAATTAVGYLAAPGVVVGTVTTGAAAPSAIEYPAAARAQATAFATAAGAMALLTPATGPHVTVVLGQTGLDTMLAALKTFPGLPAPACG